MKTKIRTFKNDIQEVKITITESIGNFYFTTIEFRDINTNKEFKKYNGCDGIYEGIKNLNKSINGFCKRHKLVEVK